MRNDNKMSNREVEIGVCDPSKPAFRGFVRPYILIESTNLMLLMQPRRRRRRRSVVRFVPGSEEGDGRDAADDEDCGHRGGRGNAAADGAGAPVPALNKIPQRDLYGNATSSMYVSTGLTGCNDTV